MNKGPPPKADPSSWYYGLCVWYVITAEGEGALDQNTTIDEGEKN